jgi:hypothetical protein
MKLKLLVLAFLIASTTVACVGKGPQGPTVNGIKLCGISTSPSGCQDITGDFSGPNR